MKYTKAQIIKTKSSNIMSKILTLILLALSLTLANTPIAQAQSTFMTDNQRRFYELDLGYFSDLACPPPDGSSTSSSASSSTLTGDGNVEIAFNFFTGKGLGDIQAAAIVGNFMAESGTNVDPEALNSIGAYGIAQWLYGRKAALLSIPDYNTLGVQLNFAWEELTGAYKASTLDPINATNDLATATRIVLERYEVPCMPGSQACDIEMTRRLPYAEQVLASFGTGNTGTSTGYNLSGAPISYSSPSLGTGVCSTGGGINPINATGNAEAIISTALTYAWPYSVKNLGFDENTDATQAYQNSSAKQYTYPRALTDCTIFVATVMRDSKADPDFPIGTDAIRRYLMENEGTKYQIIYQPTQDMLQPGDILQNLKSGTSDRGSWSGHIIIYTGEVKLDAGTFYGADASKYTRVPGMLPDVYSMTDGHPTSIAARLIK